VGGFKLSLEIIKKSISDKKKIEFFYDGMHRIVEPYVLGNTSTGKQSLRAYQVGGASNSSIPSWKMFSVMKMTGVAVIDETFLPRSDYKPDDKGMVSIFCRVE
jgi:predicted DNA-binding transcriptional regulator YafY